MALTNAEILTSIANETKNSNLKTFITTHTNLETFGTLIVTDDFEIERNALLTHIVNGIAKRVVHTKILQNKLKELKGEKIPYGSQIEEIIANPAKGTPYQMNSTDLLTQKYPDVKSVYYKINRQDKYMVTISYPQLQRALINEGGLSELINMCVGTLYSGDNVDEMRYTKELIGSALMNNKVKKIIIGDTDKIATITDNSPLMTIDTLDLGASTVPKNEKIKKFVTKARELFYNFGFANSLYNGYSSVKAVDEDDLTTACDESDQVILLRTDILSSTDVELLASAFNMGKTEFLQKVIPVDDFNGFDVWAIVCDKAWFKLNDTYYGIKPFENGSNLTVNYYLHHHQIISYNLLANAVVFIDAKDKTLNNV